MREDLRKLAVELAVVASNESLVEGLSDEDRAELAKTLRALGKQARKDRFYALYPETGPLRRELYRNHLEHYQAGSFARERCLMGGNKTGKTEVGAYETCAHLTGEYPEWWTGRKFNHPIEAWAVGKTNETTRDIIQKRLFGPLKKDRHGRNRIKGEGMMPSDRILRETSFYRAGFSGLLNEIQIRYRDSELEASTLNLKAYEQGRGSFEGTNKHFIWLDEEPPEDIYGECLIRTGTVDGIMVLTFTPLEGHTDVVMRFLPRDERPTGFDEEYQEF